MNWFRSKDLLETTIDLDYIFLINKQNCKRDEEFTIEICYIPPIHNYVTQEVLLYHDKEKRDADFDRLWKHLMKMTVVSQGASWTIDVNDLVQYRLSKEKKSKF